MHCKSLIFGGLLSRAGIGAANAAVVTTDLNLRSGPGTGYGVVATMPAGADVNVLSCSGAWCRVSWGGAVGYASASYLGGGRSYAAAPVYASPPVVGFGISVGSGWRHHYSGWHGSHARWHRPSGHARWHRSSGHRGGHHRH
jgi:uncharacterized protein YraI